MPDQKTTRDATEKAEVERIAMLVRKALRHNVAALRSVVAEIAREQHS